MNTQNFAKISVVTVVAVVLLTALVVPVVNAVYTPETTKTVDTTLTERTVTVQNDLTSYCNLYSLSGDTNALYYETETNILRLGSYSGSPSTFSLDDFTDVSTVNPSDRKVYVAVKDGDSYAGAYLYSYLGMGAYHSKCTYTTSYGTLENDVSILTASVSTVTDSTSVLIRYTPMTVDGVQTYVIEMYAYTEDGYTTATLMEWTAAPATYATVMVTADGDGEYYTAKYNSSLAKYTYCGDIVDVIPDLSNTTSTSVLTTYASISDTTVEGDGYEIPAHSLTVYSTFCIFVIPKTAVLTFEYEDGKVTAANRGAYSADLYALSGDTNALYYDVDTCTLRLGSYSGSPSTFSLDDFTDVTVLDASTYTGSGYSYVSVLARQGDLFSTAYFNKTPSAHTFYYSFNDTVTVDGDTTTYTAGAVDSMTDYNSVLIRYTPMLVGGVQMYVLEFYEYNEDGFAQGTLMEWTAAPTTYATVSVRGTDGQYCAKYIPMNSQYGLFYGEAVDVIPWVTKSTGSLAYSVTDTTTYVDTIEVAASDLEKVSSTSGMYCLYILDKSLEYPAVVREQVVVPASGDKTLGAIACLIPVLMTAGLVLYLFRRNEDL